MKTTAAMIVTQLAADEPYVEVFASDKRFCRYCDRTEGLEHLKYCIYRLAREWVTEEDAQ